MEEKNIALCILGVIAIIAIVGLILLFTTDQAAARVAQAYPDTVVQPTQESPTYAGYGVGPGVNYFVLGPLSRLARTGLTTPHEG